MGWLIFGLICVLLIIGSFFTHRPVKFTIASVIVLGALGFIGFIGMMIWAAVTFN